MQRIRQLIKQNNKKGGNTNTTTFQQDYISIIPKDLLLLIFFIVRDPYQLSKLSQVSKLFLHIACNDQLWLPFLDQISKAHWVSLGEKGEQPLSAKQFIMNEYRHLLPPFTLFSNMKMQISIRKDNPFISYKLDELVLMSSRNKKKNEGIKLDRELLEAYSAVISILNQIYDLAIDKRQSLLRIFQDSCAFKDMFVTLQEKILAEKTNSMLFKHPDTLILILQFIREIRPGQEYKLQALADVIRNEKINQSEAISQIVKYSIEYINEHEAELSMEYGRGGSEIDKIIVPHALARVFLQSSIGFRG